MMLVSDMGRSRLDDLRREARDIARERRAVRADRVAEAHDHDGGRADEDR